MSICQNRSRQRGLKPITKIEHFFVMLHFVHPLYVIGNYKLIYAILNIKIYRDIKSIETRNFQVEERSSRLLLELQKIIHNFFE